MTNGFLAIVAVLGAIGAIGLSLLSRKQGAKNWWAYMLSIPILLYWAVLAATGHGRA